MRSYAALRAAARALRRGRGVAVGHLAADRDRRGDRGPRPTGVQAARATASCSGVVGRGGGRLARGGPVHDRSSCSEVDQSSSARTADGDRSLLAGIPLQQGGPRGVARRAGARRAGYGLPGTRLRLIAAFIVLFLVLAGLADGLAPKERRYAQGAISPNNLGPPLPLPTGGMERIGIQLYGAAILPTLPADRNPQVFAKCGVIAERAARSYSLPATLATKAATFWASCALHDGRRHDPLARGIPGRSPWAGWAGSRC